MKLKNLLTSIPLLICLFFKAQIGNVGINTVLPGSTLVINGSFAAQYKVVSASTVLGASDFYMAFNGSSAGTFTLPAAIAAAPAAGNILGRIYYIKNTGTAQLTIAASGSELLDSQSGSGVASISLNPAGYAMIVSKGTISGTTWEVAAFIDKSTSTISALGASDNITYSGAALTAFNAGTPQVIPFSASNVIVNQGGRQLGMM